MFFKTKDIDATEGALLSKFIMYSIPLAIGSIIQTLFNAADMIVLGNFASSVAVASIGATSHIVNLLVNTFIGLSGGTQVILARAYGEKNKKKIGDIVNTSLIVATVLGLSLTVIGMLCSGWFLDITKCPKDCYDGAKLYLDIYLLSVPAILIYNFGSAIIRVSGDTQRPLYYLIASGILNVILNFLLCILMEDKIAAVAIATVASQVLGAALVLAQLFRTKGDCRLNLKHLSFNMSSFGQIMLIGIPCALNTSLYAISNLQIQSAINSFGSSAIAANTSAGSIEGWVSAFTGAVCTTELTFIGQNIGAKNPDRVKRTFWLSLALGVGIGLVLGVGLFKIGAPLLKIYVAGDDLAIEYGLIRMKYILAIYFIAGANGVLSSALQAFGHSLISMLNAVASVLVLRFLWMIFIYPKHETLTCLYFCFTVSWILNLVINILMTVIILPKRIKKLSTPTDVRSSAEKETTLA